MRRLHFALLILAALPTARASVSLANLTVEYRQTPLGIDAARPRFSWQMAATKSARGIAQTAYRILVRDPAGRTVWDTGRVRGSASDNVRYSGVPLSPSTRYAWSVTAWDQSGRPVSASSWFETGLMDPAPGGPAWSGARWVGGSGGDLPLYASYLSIFDLSFTVAIAPGSTRASFLYGANDPRLMDKYKNIYQLENHNYQSYIRLELDISPLTHIPPGKAFLNVYRAGYQKNDDPRKPFRSLEIHPEIIHPGNAHAPHRVDVESAFGLVTIRVDGKDSLAAARQAEPAGPALRRLPANSVNLNPAGLGWDYLTFGMLCGIGFAVDPGQSASFSDVEVRHQRPPRNVLFREDLSLRPYSGIFADALRTGGGFSVSGGAYRLDGGTSGLLLVRDPSRNSMPMLRSAFQLRNRRVSSARLYVTARGVYEFWLNGKRVGGDWYTPGFTQYNRTHLYQTYDVTPLLKPGENAMGALLGEGWWSGLLSFGTIWNHFGDRQSLLARLVVHYEGGATDVFVTNPRDWRFFSGGPLVYSSQYMGEVYDATREPAVRGWSEPGFDDSRWKAASVVPLEGTAYLDPPAGERAQAGPGASRIPLDYSRLQLIGQIDEPAGLFQTLKAKSVREARPGVYVYDLGQNIAGVPRITFREGRQGRKITVRFSEMLYPDLPESGRNAGMIMTENYRAALSQDIYVMRAGAHVFQPRFTSHGFQYIEITGLDGPLPPEDVEGLAISSVRRLTAAFRSSNEKVNRLWQNIVWSNVGNFLWIPTDCPQRNERMGWSGDLNVFSRTAAYISNAAPFLERHMRAMRDVQAPSGRFPDIAPAGGGFGGILWGSAGIVVPWEAWLQYNDLALLEEHYPAMTAYMKHLESSIDPATGLIRDAALGDWLGFQNQKLGPSFLAAAYHVWCLDVMARVAELLGKPEDAKKFRQDYVTRKEFFNRTFVSPEKKTLGIPSRGFGGGAAPAKPEFHLADTQTSYAVGLALGAFSEDNIPHMARNLAESVARSSQDDQGVLRPPYSLMTGFIGTAWISKALSQHGYTEHAYRLLQAAHFPSWLYPVEQGATTIWERLNGYTAENGFGGNNSMNSFNHYSFGAVGQWLMAHCLGIERAEPGFHRFLLQPEPDPTGEMTWAEGHYDSLYGTIRSAWKLDGDWLEYRATVPPNTVATLYLPASSPDAVTESGRPARSAPGVTLLRYEKGKAVFLLASGAYEFRARR